MDITVEKMVNKLPKRYTPVAKYIDLHESEGSLAHIRFVQDTITNWVPKVVFTRSLADFADMSFLELTENLLVYFGPALLGQGIFRKIYSKGLKPELRELVAKPAQELLKEKCPNKAVLATKAAISVAALGIPLAEYSLNYIKNLLTLNVFKQANFNNIANLDKDKKENTEQQKKVKESAKKHIKIAAGIFAGCLAFSALLATRGKYSEPLQKISEFILTPGKKLFKNNEKGESFNKYFSLDFASKEFKDKFGNKIQKLEMSKGQLMSCVLIGFLGYMGAAKDRGKQNMLEVLFRYPIVTFYVITGADLFIEGYKKILRKTGKCKELLDAEADNPEKKMTKLSNLPELAKNLATKNGTSVEEEFGKLFKQKAKLIGIPTIFSLIVMGFFVAAYSRLFTQYRYNKENQKQK